MTAPRNSETPCTGRVMPHTPLPPFSAWSGPHSANIVIVVEAWGAEEEKLRKPLVGTSGKELWRMLGEAWPDIAPEEHARVEALHQFDLAWASHRQRWLEEASLALTNVFNFRPPNNDLKNISVKKSEIPFADYSFPPLSKGGYLTVQYLGELDRLYEELSICRPNLIIAMGNTACWALLQRTDISSIRGTTTYSSLGGSLSNLAFKVLPTYHPASLFYSGMWKWRPIIVADLMKGLREGRFAEVTRPSRQILFSPTLGEVKSWVEETIRQHPPLVACDTETALGMIDTISLARTPSEVLSCQIGPHRQKVGQRWQTIWPQRNGADVTSYWTEEEEIIFWELIGRLLESEEIPKVFQNGLYDLQYLLRQGLRPKACLEDTMLQHHALYPELQKSLAFLGSIYTSEPAWKLMRRKPADSEKRDE